MAVILPQNRTTLQNAVVALFILSGETLNADITAETADIIADMTDSRRQQPRREDLTACSEAVLSCTVQIQMSEKGNVLRMNNNKPWTSGFIVATGREESDFLIVFFSLQQFINYILTQSSFLLSIRLCCLSLHKMLSWSKPQVVFFSAASLCCRGASGVCLLF